MKLKKRGIVIPDQHYPLEDRAAVQCVKKAILKIKPNVFVNLGDVHYNIIREKYQHSQNV